jgi:hypothetical protein
MSESHVMNCRAQAERLLEIEQPDLSMAWRRQWHGLPAPAPDHQQALLEARHHALGLREALAISRLLLDAAVPHAVIKGPLLQELLYGEMMHRPYSDLDFLVTPTHVRTARAALRQQGWRPRTAAWMRPLHFHEVWVKKNDAPLALEMHRAWVDRANFYRLPETFPPERWHTYRVPGGQLPGLSTGDLLLYLCLHAAKHGFLNETALAESRPLAWFLHPGSGNRLLWWMDVYLLLALCGDDMDWPRMAADVRAWNIAAPVATTLTLVEQLFPDGHAHTARTRLELNVWRPQPGSVLLRRMTARVGHRRGAGYHPRAGFRAIRLAQLVDLFFPPRPTLRAYYGNGASPGRRITHPWHMAGRLLGF